MIFPIEIKIWVAWLMVGGPSAVIIDFSGPMTPSRIPIGGISFVLISLVLMFIIDRRSNQTMPKETS